ncbi:MAG: hypothetical protein CVV05_00630 [Gammaproteobacteria bacterium HGW-Gammaproteobacteria-1]|jgi:hypothetical protein|nr:MAG: hypothetical protein CVV05_00630 [Gammaproteobacteria bacterium HGW-Gammaproteobacteria-1]
MPRANNTVSTLTRSRSRVMQHQNLLQAADITRLLAKEDSRAGQLTARDYHELQKKLMALQEGLDAVWALQGGARPVREVFDDPGLPCLARRQAW